MKKLLFVLAFTVSLAPANGAIAQAPVTGYYATGFLCPGILWPEILRPRLYR